MIGRIRQCTAQITEKPIATLSKLRFSMFFMIAIIFKYKEYVQKLIRYQDKKSGKKFINFLTKKYKKQNDVISFFALQGGIAGYRFPEQNETKNYLVNKSSIELLDARRKFDKIKWKFFYTHL